MKARHYGAERIFISSILERRGYKYTKVINRLNDQLYMACIANGYIYIDNCEILLKYHNGKDGIHPNDKGLCILKMNLLKTMLSFNPYTCDFLDEYENCLWTSKDSFPQEGYRDSSGDISMSLMYLPRKSDASIINKSKYITIPLLNHDNIPEDSDHSVVSPSNSMSICNKFNYEIP